MTLQEIRPRTPEQIDQLMYTLYIDDRVDLTVDMAIVLGEPPRIYLRTGLRDDERRELMRDAINQIYYSLLTGDVDKWRREESGEYSLGCTVVDTGRVHEARSF